MPPPLPAESDVESVAEPEGLTAQKLEALQAAQDDQESNEAAKDPEEDEEDDEDEELTYSFVVEKILKHGNDFVDNPQKEMRYLIKWKGYEHKKDLTWESEENLEGAREILEAYWAKIGGKPEPTHQKKKRGRQSTGSQVEPAKKQKRGRKSLPVPEPDATPEPPVGYADVNPDTWKPPAPNDNAWDPLVMNVDTIEKDNNGELWAYLVWNEKNDDGRFNRSKARLSTCRKACPQKMLTFYEKHV
ncbi:MAG: hypothetical protein LQ343_006371 [Gyalolechia ehrenbergii]|nr:MAG: hypothetical protein LQ343_006371 [Gyalolechia ehrenbergii]